MTTSPRTEDSALERFIEEIVVAEDSSDPFVQKLDDLLVRIASARAQLRASRGSASIRAELAKVSHSLRRAFEQMKTEHSSLDPSLLFERHQKLQRDLLEREVLEAFVTRLDAAQTPVPPPRLARRDLVERHIRMHSFALASERENNPSYTASAEAARALDSFAALFPELLEKLERNCGLLAQALDELAATKPGRPKKGQLRRRDGARLEALLAALGMASSPEARKSARRRMKNPGS
jgi:hypothetical protein